MSALFNGAPKTTGGSGGGGASGQKSSSNNASTTTTTTMRKLSLAGRNGETTADASEPTAAAAAAAATTPAPFASAASVADIRSALAGLHARDDDLVPAPPAVTLDDARASLCGLFLREFERAARGADDARVTRFFKLFPLIGRSDVGLDVYGRYVCQGVAEAARNVFKDPPAAAGGSGGGGGAAAAAPGTTTTTTTGYRRRDGFFYANALAKLFTHIAQIVESHGGLVERHYGAGQMTTVIARLQKEADVQGGIVVDAWSDERGVDRRLTDVKSYPFSFLVQSFLAQQQRGAFGGGGGASDAFNMGGGGGGGGSGRSGFGGTPRVNSPALSSGGGGGTDADLANSPRHSEDEGGVNMKEVDGLLSEITVMLSRWSLYTRFLAGKCREPGTPEDAPLLLPSIITQSNLQRKVAAKLVTPYNLMSTFFFRRSVEKAFQLEEMPSDLSLNMNRPIDNNPPYIVSAVDDVMYIVNAVIQKCMSTLQREVVVGVLPPVGRVLGSDFIGMIQRKMRDEAYPKPASSGGFPPEDKIIAFVVLINSLDMAIEYLARIVSNRMGVPVDEGFNRGGGNSHSEAYGSNGHNTNANTNNTTITTTTSSSSNPLSSMAVAMRRIPSPTAPVVVAHLRESFPVAQDAGLVGQALATLYASFTATAVELLSEGLQVLCNQVAKPRLRLVLAEAFRDADYTLPDEAAALQAAAAQLLGRLADLAARYVARALEARVWGYAGRTSAYGAIRLERDVNGIVGAVARGHYGARELFAKTTQILMVANMEDDEWEELTGGGGPISTTTTTAATGNDGGGGEDDDEDGGMVWLLSEDERRRARGMVRQAS
ncbi:cog4-like golgi transport complex subunit protein [Niveomyces insectorum RCEF 264]|uniref:Cog4-like golgi transport complex subunit protein n=1 Tax=Niveomyces insectorum RCEF 264 TaxID=1081102 RepID=A0A167TVD7_9HYPO|nr:cog4-like golgi transport complex subunit protein [Niveomyces insectorum RCEF 264]